MSSAAFLLDDDCAEVEGIPSDAVSERAMKLGSLRLLRAMQKANGSFVEEPNEVPVAPQFDRVERAHPFEGVSKGVIRAVALAYRMTPSDILSKKRSQRYVRARMVASRLLRDLQWQDGTPRFSLPQIGRMMKRDHSTICHHLDVFDVHCRHDPFMRQVYETLGDGVA